MSFEIGPVGNSRITGAPPPARRDAVGVAADRAQQLAASNRELHFRTDEKTGRVIVQVRDLVTGDVIRTIPPPAALAFLAGGA